jgi:hypothetical protein
MAGVGDGDLEEFDVVRPALAAGLISVGDGDLEVKRLADDAVGFMNPCAALGVLLNSYGGLPRSPSFSNDLFRSLLMPDECGVGSPAPVVLLFNTGLSPASLNAEKNSASVSSLFLSLSLKFEGGRLAPPLPVWPLADVIFPKPTFLL